MDLIAPGLRLNSSNSIKYINDINNNNIISFRLKKKFKELNKVTTEFLSTELASYEEANASSTNNEDLKILQEAFQELYDIIGIDNFKFHNLSKIHLRQFQKLYSKVYGVSSNDQICQKFNDIINQYLILLINLNLSNSLIYKTLVLKSRVAYWDSIRNSLFNKAIYFVQIAPCKLFEFGLSIFKQALELFEREEHETINYNSITENDNMFHHYLQVGKKSVNVVVESFCKTVKTLLRQNSNVILIKLSSNKFLRSVKLIFKSPIKLANHDISEIIKVLDKQIDINSSQINRLLTEETNLSTFESILNMDSDRVDASDNRRVNDLLHELSKYEDLELCIKTSRPSFITSYWPVIFLAVKFGPSSVSNFYNNRIEVWNFIQHNLIDTIVGFYKNWLIKPIKNMLGTLRQDEELSITSKESLKSDLDSLERMIIDFVVDEHKGQVDRQEIHNLIQNGDLTMLMSKYETEIRSPFKSLVQGSLIRSLLIQIQKTKVDGGLAINGIDKLLKSQQLVFGLVSISPSILIVYKLWSYITSAKPIVIDGKDIRILCLKSLSNIEDLVINRKKIADTEGKLLIEIINLILVSTMIIPKALKADWVKDLNELNNNKHDDITKLRLLSKIWNMYGTYFR